MKLTTLQVPSTQWALPAFAANAAVGLPNDYEKFPAKLWPVLVFFHGVGEAGKDINRMINSWFLSPIKNGTALPILEEFIVIAVQDPANWSPYPNTIRYAWNFIMDKMKLRIDENRIYTTGLSAGGQTSIMYGCWDESFAGKIAAVVSLSPAALEQQAVKNIGFFGKYSTPVWFVAGSQVGDGAFADNARVYVKAINASGGDALLTLHNAGHGGWDKIYNGSVTRQVDGKNLNIYEWMLSHSRGAVIEPPVVIPPVEPPVDPVPERKLIATLCVYDNGDVEKQ